MRIVSQAKYRHMCIGVYTHAGAEMSKRWHMLRRLSLHILSGRCLFAWWPDYFQNSRGTYSYLGTFLYQYDVARKVPRRRSYYLLVAPDLLHGVARIHLVGPRTATIRLP